MGTAHPTASHSHLHAHCYIVTKITALWGEKSDRPDSHQLTHRYFGKHRERIAETLADPDQVTRSVAFENTRLFSKYYDIARRRKYAVIVVVSDAVPTERNWIVTAYMSRKLPGGEVEWTRN